MNMKLKKVFNDLWANPGRTGLVVFALVIGLWGVGSLLVSTSILQRDLTDNFVRTSPPHAILTSRDFRRLDLTAFRSRPQIESAEFRDLSLRRIEVFPNEWIPVWIFGVQDFNNFDLARFYQEEGHKVPAPGTMLIERDGRLISNLNLGSRARVRAANRVVEIPISGICYDPAQAPATQDLFIYAYVDKQTYEEITQESSDQRLIFRLKSAKTRAEVQAAANLIVEDLQSSGITVTSLKVPKLNEHPHQWQLNTLLLLQGSIGFLAFLVGAVLVSQLMASILSRQVRQIGIFKTMGASTFQVFQIYLGMVLALGAAASLLAIPLAVKSGFAFSRFVAGKLNFNVLTTSLPLYVYVYLAAAGLLMPILFSLFILLRGVRRSVQEALSDHGIPQNSRSNRDGVASTLPLPTTLVMSFRNSLRRKRRLAVTVATMALGVAIFSTGFNVRRSLWMLLSEVRDQMRHDVQVVLDKPIPREQALAPFRSIDKISRVETWNGGRGELQGNVVMAENGVGIVALPYNTDLFIPRVEIGRWLQRSKDGEVVLNQQAVEIYRHPKVGERVTLIMAGKQLSVKLVGVVWELDRAKIYMDAEFFDASANPDHLVNSMMFVAKDKSYGGVTALKREIEKAIAPSALNVLYVMAQSERVKVVYDHLNIILTTIVFLALTVLVVSALGMASATGINVMERTREIGVLRAIGGTPSMIYRLFTAEGMIVSIASVLLGLLLSWPLSIAASPLFGNLMLGKGASLRFAFSAGGFSITLAATLAFGWLASRIPARGAIRVSTREALAYE